jgi:ribosomal protein S27AE
METLHKMKTTEKPGNTQNQLGITDDGGKIKFDPHYGQKEFREYVEARADHMTDTGYVQGEPDDFNWHFEPEYATDKLTPIKKDADGWKAWYHGELHEWQYDHGDERKGHFEKWAQNPAHKPVIVIEGLDHDDHIIDGHHRVGMAHIKHMKTIPVLYGRRKLKKTEWESLSKVEQSEFEELAKKCPRCGGASANSSNPAGRCRKHLTQLSDNKKKPGHWQRAQTQADGALRRQDGKNGTASHKSSGRGSRKEIVSKMTNAEKKTGQKLSADRVDNAKGYASGNTRAVPEKLNRGRHKVDPKKLAAWKAKLKKYNLEPDDFMTLLQAKTLEYNDETLSKTLETLDIERVLGIIDE